MVLYPEFSAATFAVQLDAIYQVHDAASMALGLS
jgi:hypothetical protein